MPDLDEDFILAWGFCCGLFCFVFEVRSQYVALTGLEFST